MLTVNCVCSQETFIGDSLITMQAANLAGFRASEDPRFEAGIPDFMNGILNFSIHINVVHRKVDWRNPKMKSLNSMPGMAYRTCSHISSKTQVFFLFTRRHTRSKTCFLLPFR